MECQVEEEKMRKISEFGLVENCDYYRETKTGGDSNHSDHMMDG